MIAVGAVGGVALAGVALVDWHYALRYVGTLGAQVSLVRWLTSYDSPQVMCAVCPTHPDNLRCQAVYAITNSKLLKQRLCKHWVCSYVCKVHQELLVCMQHGAKAQCWQDAPCNC